MPRILHITQKVRWEQALAEGEYRGDTLATEGFIHCSTREQLPRVAATLYKGQTGLVVLRIDPMKLKPPLRWECPSDSDDEFPHLHGPLNLDAVVDVVSLEALGVHDRGPGERRVLRAVGYWKSDHGSDDRFPDPRSLVQPGWHAEEIDRIIAYLKSGRRFEAWLGDSYCRFGCWDGSLDFDDDEEAAWAEAVARHGEPADMGTSDLYDGEWVWPEGLAHYVERHSVRLPEEFVEGMRSRSWTVPELPEEPEVECEGEEPEGVYYADDSSFWISWAEREAGRMR
jgi:uncharacterized protein (DUF952 family)